MNLQKYVHILFSVSSEVEGRDWEEGRDDWGMEKEVVMVVAESSVTGSVVIGLPRSGRKEVCLKISAGGKWGVGGIWGGAGGL